MFKSCEKCRARFDNNRLLQRHISVKHPTASHIPGRTQEAACDSSITTEDSISPEPQELEFDRSTKRLLTPSVSDVELDDLECPSPQGKQMICNHCNGEFCSYEELKVHYRKHASDSHENILVEVVSGDAEQFNEVDHSSRINELCNAEELLSINDATTPSIQVEKTVTHRSDVFKFKSEASHLDIGMPIFNDNPLTEEMNTKVTLPQVTEGYVESAVSSLTSSYQADIQDVVATIEFNCPLSAAIAEDVSSIADLYECEASTSSGQTSVAPTDQAEKYEVGRNGKRVLPFARGSKEWKEYRNARAKEYRNNREDLCCPLCSYTAKFSNKLNLHLNTVHQKGRFKCSYCADCLDSLQERRKHEASRHPIFHQCDQCGYQHKAKRMVDRHIRQIHCTEIKCTVPGCNQSFSKYKLRAHLVSKHFSNSTECSTVVINRISKGYFQCPHCDHREISSDDIEDHIQRVHTNGIRCPLGCSLNFSLDDLDMHIRTMHADDRLSSGSPCILTRRMANEEERLCPSVSYLTPTETSVADTNTITTESLAENTMDTDKSDYESSDMDDNDDDYLPQQPKNHILGSLECSYCNKTFTENPRLRKHINSVHLNPVMRSRPKKYSCPVSGCDKSFAAPTLLQDHIYIHQGIAAYNCSHCNQSFAARARFAVHLKRYHSMSIKTYEQFNRSLGRNTTSQVTIPRQSSQAVSDRLTNFLNNTIDES